jgi:hypothetical protein
MRKYPSSDPNVIEILPDEDASKIGSKIPQGWNKTKITDYIINGREKMLSYYLNHFQKTETIEKLKGGKKSAKEVLKCLNSISIRVYLSYISTPKKGGAFQWVNKDEPFVINVNWFWFNDDLSDKDFKYIDDAFKGKFKQLSESDFYDSLIHEGGHCVQIYLTLLDEMNKSDIKDCTYYDKDKWKELGSQNSYILDGEENFARLQVIRKELGLSGNKRNDELVRAFENKVNTGAFKSPNVEITIDDDKLYFIDTQDPKLSKIKNMPNPEPQDIENWMEERIKYEGKTIGHDMCWLFVSYSQVLPYDDKYRIAVDLSRISQLNREWVKADTDKNSVVRNTG